MHSEHCSTTYKSKRATASDVSLILSSNSPPCDRRRTGGAGARNNTGRSCAVPIDEAALQQQELDSELVVGSSRPQASASKCRGAPFLLRYPAFSPKKRRTNRAAFLRFLAFSNKFFNGPAKAITEKPNLRRGRPARPSSQGPASSTLRLRYLKKPKHLSAWALVNWRAELANVPEAAPSATGGGVAVGRSDLPFPFLGACLGGSGLVARTALTLTAACRF